MAHSRISLGYLAFNRKIKASHRSRKFCQLLGVWPDGNKKPIRIQIGKPYKDHEIVRCDAAIHGLYEKLNGVASGDSFSSLCLAMGLIRRLLLEFQEKGGRLFFDSDDIAIEANEEIDLTKIWDLHGPGATD